MTSVAVHKSFCVLFAKLLYEVDCVWLYVVSNRLSFFRCLSVRQPVLVCPEITNSSPNKIDIITLDALVPSLAVKIYRYFQAEIHMLSFCWFCWQNILPSNVWCSRSCSSMWYTIKHSLWECMLPILKEFINLSLPLHSPLTLWWRLCNELDESAYPCWSLQSKYWHLVYPNPLVWFWF